MAKKKAQKQVEKQVKAVSTVSIIVSSDVLIDKRYKVGTHEISDELAQQIEHLPIVKKGIVKIVA